MSPIQEIKYPITQGLEVRSTQNIFPDIKNTFDYVYEDVETAIEFKLHTVNFNFFALKFLIFEYTKSNSNKFNFLLILTL